MPGRGRPVCGTLHPPADRTLQAEPNTVHRAVAELEQSGVPAGDHLIERQVRQALGPQRTMRGFYLEPRAVRPTGELILTALSELRIRPGTATSPPIVVISTGIQAQLLELLDVDPTRPRWLDTRFPTCERQA